MSFDKAREHELAADALERTYGRHDRAVCGHRRMARWMFALAWVQTIVSASLLLGGFIAAMWVAEWAARFLRGL